MFLSLINLTVGSFFKGIMQYIPSEGFCLVCEQTADCGSCFFQGSGRLFDDLACCVFAVGERSIRDCLAEIFVSGGAVLLCEAADVASLETGHIFYFCEGGEAFHFFAFLDDAVVVDAEHDDSACVEAAGLTSECDLAFSPELDELVGEVTHLQETEKALHGKRNTYNND